MGLLFVLQPSIITWGHAVMLNLPSTTLAIAALYHWRRWLEHPASRHVYLAAASGLLAILTYPLVAIVVPLMLCWALVLGRSALLTDRRVLWLGGSALALLAPWAVIQWAWAPTQVAAGLHLGDYPLWKPTAWTFYLHGSPNW